MSIGQELLNAPFPELVKNLGVGIAEAQYALDRVSVRIAQMMGGFKYDNDGNFVQDNSALVKLSANSEPVSLLALGFTPTFYQYVETYIELKMAISMSTSKEASVKVKAKAKIPFGIFSASVNASYSQKYQYEANGSSEMRTKLVTVPAPVIFEQRVKDLLEMEKNKELE
ncbi:MAG: hypothetical protein PF484_01850 [Bacteroidales bacterium]|jgi:hypothetical protein|nr:hypothetical protein [Bacteroidales bacterium]